MCEHAKTFHANKDYNLTMVVLIPTSPLPKEKFVVHLSNVIFTKMRPYLFIYLFIYYLFISNLFLANTSQLSYNSHFLKK